QIAYQFGSRTTVTRAGVACPSPAVDRRSATPRTLLPLFVLAAARGGTLQRLLICYLPAGDSAAFSICSLTASRLKLAPFCIGGNSIAVWASFATSCWTNWKRQNSKTNQL